jgi:hypothetical protein
VRGPAEAVTARLAKTEAVSLTRARAEAPLNLARAAAQLSKVLAEMDGDKKVVEVPLRKVAEDLVASTPEQAAMGYSWAVRQVDQLGKVALPVEARARTAARQVEGTEVALGEVVEPRRGAKTRQVPVARTEVALGATVVRPQAAKTRQVPVARTEVALGEVLEPKRGVLVSRANPIGGAGISSTPHLKRRPRGRQQARVSLGDPRIGVWFYGHICQ